MKKKAKIRVALAGNPNAGKTSLFNALTGARQHVGNYPGVTVEKREGFYLDGDRRVELSDLPGTYSLSSYSPEERIAQDELLGGAFDVVVVVADSTSLQRSLVILAQLLQLDINPVLALNMADEARRAGQRLDLEQLGRLLGFPVVETVGHRAEGVQALREAIGQTARAPLSHSRLVLGERLARALEPVEQALEAIGFEARGRSWIATKLLLDDPLFVDRVATRQGEHHDVLAVAQDSRQRLQAETGLDVALFVTERYYAFVDGLLREVLLQRPRENARATSDRIDTVLAHRLLGLPVFFAVMYGVFWLTFTVGEIPMTWIEAGFAWLGAHISSLWPAQSESALRSLLVDGVIGGVGGVIVFLPNIVLLFACLVFLEDSGYMARAAFLMDRLMHRFGLHGRSFIPMMTGFGCSVPGIMATRTLENERDRLTTMLVLPLMSCGARLPIWMLLIPAFFAPVWRAPMLWLIYMIGIVLALLLALALRSSLLKGDDAPFVMELPPYRLPTWRSVLTRMNERSWFYLRKAGTVILGISILMWAASSYPQKKHYVIDRALSRGVVRLIELRAPPDLSDAQKKQWTEPRVAALQAGSPGVEWISHAELDARRQAEATAHSFAGRVGRLIEPLLQPLGFDWRIATALIGAFAAKEVFVAQMGIVFSLGEANESSAALRSTLARTYSPLQGFSLMIFLLIATPCMATLAVTRRESGSWKWALLQSGGLSSIAYLLSLLVYQLGRLLGAT